MARAFPEQCEGVPEHNGRLYPLTIPIGEPRRSHLASSRRLSPVFGGLTSASTAEADPKTEAPFPAISHPRGGNLGWWDRAQRPVFVVEPLTTVSALTTLYTDAS